MRITFKVDHTPDGQAPNRPTYKAGKSYSFNDPVGETYARKYVRRGWAVEAPPEVSQATAEETEAARLAEEAAAEAASLQAEADKLAARGAVVIPDDWTDLPWPELRSLAAQVTDEPVKSKDDAITAIEDELSRRAAG